MSLTLFFIQPLLIFFLFMVAGLPFVYAINKISKSTFLKFNLSIAPIFGASVIIVIGFLHIQKLVNAQIIFLVITACLVVNIFLVLDLIREIAKKKFYFIRQPQNLFYILIAFFATLYIFWSINPSYAGILTLRLGIDISAYASATSFLLHENINNNYLGISSTAARDILEVNQRYALPILAVFVKNIFPHFDDIYSLLFSILFVLYISLAMYISFSAFKIFSTNIGFSYYKAHKKNFSFFIFLAIAFNPPLLYFLYEGFYAQILSTVFLNAILLLYLALRQSTDKSFICIFAPLLTIFILFFAMALAYKESILIFLAILIGFFVFDIISKVGETVKKILLLAIFFLLGSALTYWFFNSFNNHFNPSVGYPQPNWLFPSEIIGLGTIYNQADNYLDNDIATQLVQRSNIDYIITALLSFFTIKFFYDACKLFNCRKVFYVFTLVILSVFLFNYFMPGMQPGYAYNKFSSMLSPLIILFVLSYLFKVSFFGNFIKFPFLIPFLFILFTLITSSSTLVDLKTYSSELDIKSAKDIDIKLKECDCVLLTYERGYRNGQIVKKMRYTDRTADMTLATIMNVPIIDQWDTEQIRLIPSNKKVFIMLRNNSLNDFSGIKKNSLIYKNNYYSIYDTYHISNYFKSGWVTDDDDNNAKRIRAMVQLIFDNFKSEKVN